MVSRLQRVSQIGKTFPLAEKRKIKIHGIETLCLVRTKELEHTYGWYAQYDAFVKYVMDAKLHLKTKDCSDPLEIDQDESRPYSIHTLFAQFAFCAMKNTKTDRYIPIKQLRKILKAGIGDKCDVDGIINEYLKKEAEQKKIELSSETTPEEYAEACIQDASEVFRQSMDYKIDQLQKEREQYKVSDYEGLIYYRKGDSIKPIIRKSVRESFIFYRSILDEKYYKELMTQNATDRCRFLVEENRSILIRDKDWRKIFKDIEEHEEAFARYYPMVRVKISSDGTYCIVKAIVLNNDLYRYCCILAEEEEDDSK